MSTKIGDVPSSSKLPVPRDASSRGRRLPSRQPHVEVIVEGGGKDASEPSRKRPSAMPPSPLRRARSRSDSPPWYHSTNDRVPGEFSMEYPNERVSHAHPLQVPPNSAAAAPASWPLGAAGHYAANAHRYSTHPPLPADGYSAANPFGANSGLRNEGVPQGITYDDIDAGPPAHAPGEHMGYPQPLFGHGQSLFNSRPPVPWGYPSAPGYPQQGERPPQNQGRSTHPSPGNAGYTPTFGMPFSLPTDYHPPPRPEKPFDAGYESNPVDYASPPSSRSSSRSSKRHKYEYWPPPPPPPVIVGAPMPHPAPAHGTHRLSHSYIDSHPGRSQNKLSTAALFLTRDVPKEIYILLLLRLPALYFSRVSRIFEEADMTLGEIKKMALESAASNTKPRLFDSVWYTPRQHQMPDAYDSLRNTWEAFIDSVMREWKTFNIISVLLLSAILTILQIDAAAADAITRYTALGSLICALMSLLYGCMYIIRFGTMRRPYKAAEWALEAQKSKTAIFWNVWVMLAMPAVWLSWSLILYIACIMSFVWRTSTHSVDRGPLSDWVLLTVRIAVTVLLGLGMLYGSLVLFTFRRYGDVMDKAWKMRVKEWIAPQGLGSHPYYAQPPPHPYYVPRAPSRDQLRSRTPKGDEISGKEQVDGVIHPISDSDDDFYYETRLPPRTQSHRENSLPAGLRRPRRSSNAEEAKEGTVPAPSHPSAVKTNHKAPAKFDNERDGQHRREARVERTRRHKRSDSTHARQEDIPRDPTNRTEMQDAPSAPPSLPPKRVHLALPPEPSTSMHHHPASATRTRRKERVPLDTSDEIQGVRAEKGVVGVRLAKEKEGVTGLSSPPPDGRKPVKSVV